ncbi:MAG: hypothetical protein ACRD63_01400 [Pyrinomonadaceae bacterium]
MSPRLTVILYILLCLEAGIVLTLLPWIHPFGIGDWGDNFILFYVSQKTGLYGLQSFVASGWMRGAVSGIGLLNLFLSLREILNFRRTVAALDAKGAEQIKSQSDSKEDVLQKGSDLPHHSGPDRDFQS